MLQYVAKLFESKHPRQKATMAIARLLNKREMEVLPFKSGLETNRRSASEIPYSVGVWIAPIDGEQHDHEVDLTSMVKAVTYDMRSEGMGILTPIKVHGSTFAVALPDGDQGWRFFVTQLCHNSLRPGDWYQIGMHTVRILEPNESQIKNFLRHIQEFSEPCEQQEIVSDRLYESTTW